MRAVDEIVMVVDAQMPIRAKRIQYFDDRLFKAIHDVQTGELPFPEPGGGGLQGTLPLSVQAMPMFPRSTGGDANETVSESADHVRGESKQPPTRADGSPKKSAAVVQAVVAEAQRQMEMDFAAQVPATDSERESDDEQVRNAVGGLEELESTLKQGV